MTQTWSPLMSPSLLIFCLLKWCDQSLEFYMTNLLWPFVLTLTPNQYLSQWEIFLVFYFLFCFFKITSSHYFQKPQMQLFWLVLPPRGHHFHGIWVASIQSYVGRFAFINHVSVEKLHLFRIIFVVSDFFLYRKETETLITPTLKGIMVLMQSL